MNSFRDSVSVSAKSNAPNRFLFMDKNTSFVYFFVFIRNLLSLFYTLFIKKGSKMILKDRKK